MFVFAAINHLIHTGSLAVKFKYIYDEIFNTEFKLSFQGGKMYIIISYDLT